MVLERGVGDQSARRGTMAIALFAVLLGLVHLGGASTRQQERQASVEAGEAFAAMQAGLVRETVLYAFGNNPGLDKDVRAAELGEALRLRHGLHGGTGGPGIVDLQKRAREARVRSDGLATIDVEYELAEAGLQLAILAAALSLTLARRRLLIAGGVLAAGSVLLALVAVAAQLLG